MVSSECKGMLYHWELDFGTEHVNIGTENDEPVWMYVHS